MAGGRPKVKLVSSAGTGYYKTTTEQKNKKVEPKKMYDPVIRKHVMFNRKSKLS